MTRMTRTTAVVALLALGACTNASVEVVVENQTGEASPLTNKLVAIDDVYGERTEVWTDDDGVAVFRADWDNDGPYDVTVDGEDFGLRTILGLVEADDGRRVVLENSTLLWPRWTTISGTASPRTPDTTLVVIPQRHVGWVEKTEGSTYLFGIPTGEPNIFVAAEYVEAGETKEPVPGTILDREVVGWHRFELEATAALETTFDLDLTNPVSGRTDAGTVGVPDELRNDDAIATMTVHSDYADFVTWCGFETSIALGPGGQSYDYEVEYLPPTDDAELRTTIAVRHTDILGYMTWSWLRQDGTPSSWATQPELLPVPAFDTSDEHPSMAGRMHLQAVPADALARIQLRDEDETLWLLDGPVGETTIAFPDPPSTYDADRLETRLHAIPMSARPGTGVDHAAGGKGRWLWAPPE